MSIHKESKKQLQMYKKILLLPILLASMSLIVSCDSGQMNSIDDIHNVDDQPELKVVNGGINAAMKVNRAEDSYFHLLLSNTGPNRHLATGTRTGWPILWESAISHDTTYEDVTLFSTYDEEYWKPVNYLLNERKTLKKEDNQLTYREIQAAIWTLLPFTGFDLDNTSADLLSPDMVRNGEVNFDREKVRQIAAQAKSNGRSFTYTPKTTYALVAKSQNEGQFMIIEETAYAFEVVDLKSEHNMVVAWDINDHGQIVGGNSFLDERSGVTSMGNIAARALNNQGRVVGSNGSQAAYWDAGNGVVNLSLEGDMSEASDINDSGQIVGEVMYETLLYEDDEYGDEYDYDLNAFVWSSNDDWQTIGNDGWATGINNNSLAVGTDYSVTNRGFIWDEQEGMRSLGTFSGYSSARPNAINNNDQVVGSVLVAQNGGGNMIVSSRSANEELSKTIDEIERAFKKAQAGGTYHYAHVMEMVQNSTFEREAFPWKNELNGRLSVELPQLNQIMQGKIASVALSNSRSEAFLWNETEGMMNLGTLGGNWSTAWDVNDHGQVVGYSDIGDSQHRAFYWDEEHGMIELPGLGGNSLARAMNNEGQIVGYSYDSDGNFYPVLWNLSVSHP